MDCLMVDLRNHGDSFHDQDNLLSAHSDDLVRVLDQEGLDRVHLIGHSFGGKVGVKFAIENPTRVETLTLIDISPLPIKNPLESQVYQYLG